MINFASNLNKMIDAGLGGPLDPPRTEVAVGHRVVYTEVSGAVASFETNVIAPVKNLRVTMEPIQAGSGDPSPENIRPITGRDSVTVARTGINVFDKSEVVDGVYISNTNGSEGPNANSKATGWISVVPGEKYYILTEQTSGAWGAWYDRNKTYIGKIIGYLPSGNQKEQTAPSNAAYMRLTCYSNGSGNIDTFAVNHPSTDHDYHAYNGKSATIQLGQTVYGGTVDVTTGVLTVTRGEIASYAGETLPGEWISDRDVYAAGTTPTIGAQVVYELADSFTIDLTPAQLTTLKGQNNVWSDAGNISLEYPYYEETEGY